MDFSEPQVNIVIFFVDTSSFKEHAFQLNIEEFRKTVFPHHC